MKNKKLFDKYSDGNHWEKHPTNYANEFISFLRKTYSKEILSGITIIDLGCGNGRDVVYFCQCGISARGFDNKHETIESAEKTWPNYKSCFYDVDIENLPIWEGIQQAYFCINVMHYVDSANVLREIYRTLKPGGYAFIHFNLLIVDQNYNIDYHQTKTDVYKLVKDFEIVEEKTFIREDVLPEPHTHHILQLILQKPKK